MRWKKKNLHIYLHHYSLIQFYAICVVRVTVKLHLTSRLTRKKKHIYFVHILWTLVWVNATTRNINLEKKKYLPHANLLKCLPLSNIKRLSYFKKNNIQVMIQEIKDHHLPHVPETKVSQEVTFCCFLFSLCSASVGRFSFAGNICNKLLRSHSHSNWPYSSVKPVDKDISHKLARIYTE